MDELEGQILTSISGTKYYLSKIIGQGAQGIIYSTADDEYVVKLYKKESELKNKKKLKKLNWLLKTDYPDQFIKPLDIIDSPYIGYVMKKVKGHVSLNKLLIPNRGMAFSDWYNQETGELYRRLLIGEKIALQFANLHKKNMAYCDLSGNNILVNENKGVVSVCMIDIDNIYVPGNEDINVLGTSRYIAPEVYKKQINPDIFTDSYSLAVILFELIKVGHPYIGDLIEDGTPEQMTEAYKGLYPYVDDPNTDLNRSTQMLPAKVVFTSELENLFYQTFVKGKDNRIERVRALEFAAAFLRAANLLVKCSECGSWHYAKPNENKKYLCPWCDKPYEKPFRLSFYERYDCKHDEKKIDIVEKHICDFILKEKVTNVITKNYINDIYTNNDEESFEEYFKIRLGKDGKYYALNENGNFLAHLKIGEKKFNSVKKGEIVPLERGERLLFSNPPKMEVKEIDTDLTGISFRYAKVL